MPADKRRLAHYLRTERGRSDPLVTQVELAKRAGISPSYLSYIEKGKKLPTLSIVLALASALRVGPERRNDILRAAGYNPTADSELDLILRPIYTMFEDVELTVEERSDFARALQGFVARQQSLRQKRKERIEKAVLVAAGWQPRLLAPESLERTLFHAAHEVAQAHIPHLVTVVARETPDSTFEELRRRSGLRIDRVFQEQPLGLGNAVWVARESIGEEAFALILPDDIDPSGATLRKLVVEYGEARRPILAVNPGPLKPASPETLYYGVAILGERVSKGSRLRTVLDVREKPRESKLLPSNRWMVVGRYILTAEIFGELQTLKPNERTRRYELTDALAAMLRTQSIMAYELEQRMLPLAPVRSVIDRLIGSMEHRTKFEHILELTEHLLKNIDALD